MSTEQVTYILNLRDRVTRSLKTMQSGFVQTDKTANSFGNTLKRLGTYMLASFSLRQLGRFTSQSLKAWDVQDKAVKQVEQGLISTANVSGKTLGELTKQASNLQKKTLFGDEKVLGDVTAQLLTFTNIAGKEFDRTQMAALDLSTRVKQDLRSSTIQLGKALNDPVANLGALSRSGIQFSQTQKDMIKRLWETGQQAKAQSLILDELERQYGGSAAAAAAAGTGGFTQLQNRLGDLQEQIGKTLAQSFTKAMPQLNKLVDRLGVVMPKYLERLGRSIDFVVRNFDSIISIVGMVTKTFIIYKVTVFTITKITKILTVANNLMRISYIAMNRGMKSATKAMKGFNAASKANVIGLVITGITLLLPLISKLFDRTSKLTLKQRTLNEVNKRASEIHGEQAARVRTLYNTVKLGNITEQQRANIIKEVNKNYGQYLPKLLKENATNKEIAEALKEVNRQMLFKAKLQAISEKITEESRKQLEIELKMGDAVEVTKEATSGWANTLKIAWAAWGGKQGIKKQIQENVIKTIDEYNAKIKESVDKQKLLQEMQAKIQKQVKGFDFDLGGKVIKNLPTQQIKGEIVKDKKAEKQIQTITGAAPKTFNINIESLINEFNLNTENITEGASEVKKQIIMALSEALADVQPIRD